MDGRVLAEVPADIRVAYDEDCDCYYLACEGARGRLDVGKDYFERDNFVGLYRAMIRAGEREHRAREYRHTSSDAALEYESAAAASREAERALLALDRFVELDGKSFRTIGDACLALYRRLPPSDAQLDLAMEYDRERRLGVTE
jgi:hypothetical protein